MSINNIIKMCHLVNIFYDFFLKKRSISIYIVEILNYNKNILNVDNINKKGGKDEKRVDG